MKFSILSKAREQAKRFISNQSNSMRGKSKSKSCYFKVGDGRRRGSPHEGWEKRQGGSKYVRGQTTTDISKTGECILRDNVLHTEPKETIMQLRTKTPCTMPQPSPTTEAERDTYRLLHAGKTCDMFNAAYHMHMLQSPNCPTNLQFDFEREKQKGVCWKETLKCIYCNFHSESTKLYEETESETRGAKTAKPNIGLWVALMDNPIMGTTLQEIFMALNCPAPSYTGLHYTASKVGPQIVNMVREDLQRERAHLKDVLESHGFPRQTPIPVEGDGRYNNPLYWSRDRTPFQPATQMTYTVSENVTPEKKIIGIALKNKLCHNRVIGRTCPDHPGKCTATLMIDEPIGREDLATEEICQEFLSDPEPTYVSHITTDGDSAASRGVQKAMGVHGQTVEALRDTRHLAQSQKKAIDNAKFSERMFPGRTATDRQGTKRKFSIDLMKRCSAEYDLAIKKHCGDTEKLVNALSYATDSIVDCYAGRCGRTCADHSFVCKGHPEKCWPKEYLPPHARTLHPTKEDEDTIRGLVSYRFNRNTLTTTRYGTNTQKSEALHRGYSKSNPKNITCSANFGPKIFSAVHRLNHGPGESTTLKCSALGSPLPSGTRVSHQLKRRQEKYSRDRQRKQSSAYRAKRHACVKNKFEMYFQRKTDSEVGYVKGMNNPPLPKPDTEKKKKEHSYSKARK